MLKYLLGRLGLQLNETKTKTVNAWDHSFDFLGFEIRMNRSPRSGRSYPHVQPGTRAVQRIKADLTALSGRKPHPDSSCGHRSATESVATRLVWLLSLSQLHESVLVM